MDSRLHYAPLSNPKNILDIGTGTGIWAIEMGDQYPEAHIEATDLSDWGVPADHYDFVHTRFLLGCFTDFKQVIAHAYRNVKPGGWMESQEAHSMPSCDDGTMPDDWPVLEWHRRLDQASMSPDLNRPLRIAGRSKNWYIEAGFVDVQEVILKLPLNSWPKDPKLKTLGRWWGENMLMGMQGFSMAFFSRMLGWSREEIEVR
jgi:hypothetical protein